MAEIVVMPRMNLTMENGLLAYWYKRQGDAVRVGEALCSVENEKETVDLESPASGVLVKVWAAQDEKYAVGTPLCLIANTGEDAASAIAEAERGMQKAAETAEVPASDTGSGPSAARFRILPKVRNIARQKGVTVEQLRAHFGEVPVTEAHIDQYLSETAAGAGPGALFSGRRVKLTEMRKAIAAAMTLSVAKTARLTNFMEADMTAAMEMLSAVKRRGAPASVTALVVKACAAAIREHGIVNTVLDEGNGEIVYRDEVNIGFAVDVPGGLLVPVIKGADQKTAEQLAAAVASLAEKALAGSLTGEDTGGGTFTVSNVGMLGVESFTPIIRYPETAILGVGEIKTLPRYIGNDYTHVQPRQIMKLALTYDHRVIDGAPAARFLGTVRALLEHPETLFEGAVP